MIICVVIGIILAKKGKAGWIVYLAGAALTVLSIIGRVRSERMMWGQTSSFTSAYLGVFVGLAAIGAVLIGIRRMNSAQEPEAEQEPTAEETTPKEEQEPTAEETTPKEEQEQ